MKNTLCVNNYVIPDEAIEMEFKCLMRSCPKNLSAGDLENVTAKFKQKAGDLAVNRYLLLEEARSRGIEVSDAEINALLAQAKGKNTETRVRISDACKVEKLISSIVTSVPKPAREEIVKHLKEAANIDADSGGENTELMRKLVDKTGVLLHRLRQNLALNDFIAELRKKATIIGQDNQQCGQDSTQTPQSASPAP